MRTREWDGQLRLFLWQRQSFLLWGSVPTPLPSSPRLWEPEREVILKQRLGFLFPRSEAEVRGYKDQGCHLSGLGTEIGQRRIQTLIALSPLGENPEVSKFPLPPPPTHRELLDSSGAGLILQLSFQRASLVAQQVSASVHSPQELCSILPQGPVLTQSPLRSNTETHKLLSSGKA